MKGFNLLLCSDYEEYTMILNIRHAGQLEERSAFHVINSETGEQTDLVCLESPDSIFVAGNRTLPQELQWYLEEFLKRTDGFEKRADLLLRKLDQWGNSVFNALFEGGIASQWMIEAIRKDSSKLRICVCSKNPAVLAWPWEALCSSEYGVLSHHCGIERLLDIQPGDLESKTNELPGECINILYIIARPNGVNDVGVGALIRPLLDYIREGNWPVNVNVLRPPTLKKLVLELQERPNFYHIVHFDGHGAFMRFLNTPQGLLAFETDSGSIDWVSAKKFANVIKACNIPMMALNACQSAMNEPHCSDTFSSISASILGAGIHDVIAMSYNLMVAGAKEFVPTFYKLLFETGNVEEALHEGRMAMLSQPERPCPTGTHKLYDWSVPVLYRNDVQNMYRLPILQPIAETRARNYSIPNLEKHGFIGREQALLQLERALRNESAGILIHGVAGTGKTTLAIGFLQWLQDTNGLGEGAIWISFAGIRDVESAVINPLITQLPLSTHTLSLPLHKKIERLSRELRECTYIVVWDNFESTEKLSKSERDILSRLLESLCGGKSKVIITGRAMEADWLDPAICSRMMLEGLQGEELWSYCNTVAKNLDMHLSRDDATVNLLGKLSGNPLALRAIILKLIEKPAQYILREFNSELISNCSGNGAGSIQAVMAVFDRDLDAAYEPVQQLLGLHEDYVNITLLTNMLTEIGVLEPYEMSLRLLQRLERAGYCAEASQYMWFMHPALRSYLLIRHPASENAEHAFIKVVANIADQVAAYEAHEQKLYFQAFDSLFYQALELSRKHKMVSSSGALLQCLGVYMLYAWNLREAKRYFFQLIDIDKEYQSEAHLSVTYHQLGMVAEQQHDYDTSEYWYKKSIEIKERIGEEGRLALTYHQLGFIAIEQRKFRDAEFWLNKSLAIDLKLGDDRGAAKTYHNFGKIALCQRDYNAAKGWYEKALDLETKMEDDNSIAQTYNDLGIIAREEHNYLTAEQMFQRALRILETLGIEHELAGVYHNMGILAQEQRDFVASEQLYKQALKIYEKEGDDNTARLYFNIGGIAKDQNDYDSAELWLKKALSVYERQDDKHGLSLVYFRLSEIADKTRDFDSAERWCRRAIDLFENEYDDQDLAICYHQYGNVFLSQRNYPQAEQWYKKALDIKTAIKDESAIAVTYHQMGMVAEMTHDYDVAAEWYNKALIIRKNLNDEHGMAETFHQLGILKIEVGDYDSANLFLKQSSSMFEKQGDAHNAAASYHQSASNAREQEDYHTAEQLAHCALNILERQGDEYGVAASCQLLGIILQDQNRFHDAKKYYMRALMIFNNQEDKEGIALVCGNLGSLHEEIKEYAMALFWLLKAMENFQNIPDSHNLNLAERSIKRIEEELKMDARTQLSIIPQSTFKRIENIQLSDELMIEAVSILEGMKMTNGDFISADHFGFSDKLKKALTIGVLLSLLSSSITIGYNKDDGFAFEISCPGDNLYTFIVDVCDFIKRVEDVTINVKQVPSAP